MVEVRRDASANGVRLLIRDLATGNHIYLDPLELEALTRMDHSYPIGRAGDAGASASGRPARLMGEWGRPLCLAYGTCADSETEEADDPTDAPYGPRSHTAAGARQRCCGG